MSGIIGTSNFGRASAMIAAAAAGDNTPFILVTKSGSQSVTRDGWSKVTWDTETVDSDGAFASDKFTVPANEGGRYHMHVKFNINSNGGSCKIGMYKNGSYVYNSSNESNSNTVETNWIVNLAATDYIETYAYAGEPSPSVQADSFFSAWKIIE